MGNKAKAFLTGVKRSVSNDIAELAAKSNLNFNNSFTWYKNTLEKALNNAVENFFEIEFNFKLVSVSETPNIATKNDSFFVTQIKLYENVATSLKISQNATDMLLEVALGKNVNGFEIEYLTELEAKVLTAFNHNLYKISSKYFAPGSKIKTLIKENELKKDYIYLTFMTQKDGISGKIIMIFPSQLLLEPEFSPPVEDSIPEEFFEECPVEVDIYVGKTKILLEDVKLLQKEDLVVLEKSDISTMKTIGDFEFKFNVNPDPMLVYNYQEDSDYETSEDNMTDTKTNKNRWDLIQVDMTAEFDKIKMPLGELRQISKGLIVDLADVYQNDITLKVENNAIAKGELVIIDDKYGVLIKEIFTEETHETSEDEDSEDAVTNTSSDAENENDDDFDLEDFDIDEDDLDDDDDFDDDFDDEDI